MALSLWQTAYDTLVGCRVERKGGEETPEESDGCHLLLGHKEWMISKYLSPDEWGMKGWAEREKQCTQTGTSCPGWSFPNRWWEVRGKSCAPYFADCPSDKIKSLEGLGDVLRGPLPYHRADSRRKYGGTHIYTHASWQCCLNWFMSTLSHTFQPMMKYTAKEHKIYILNDHVKITGSFKNHCFLPIVSQRRNKN